MSIRCWDNSLNTQPTFVRSAWWVYLLPSSHPIRTNNSFFRNWDLHVTSSCHRIKVFSVNRSRPATAARLKIMEEKKIDFLPLTKPLPFDMESDAEYEAEMEKRAGRDPEE